MRATSTNRVVRSIIGGQVAFARVDPKGGYGIMYV